MKKLKWNDGFDLDAVLLNWRETAFEEEISTRMKNIMKSKGVCLAYEAEDVLLPRSSLIDSECYISDGVSIDSDGKICKLLAGYDLHCVAADVGKYIQIEHKTVENGPQPHPVDGVVHNTKIDYDVDGDNIITKSLVEDSSKVTLGKITACVTDVSVSVDTTTDVGHREVFSTYLVDKDPPTTPEDLTLTTGFDDDLVSSEIVGEVIEDASRKTCWVKAEWSGCSDDYGIDSYQVSFIPVVPSGDEEEEYPDREETIEVRIGSPINNWCFRSGFVSGMKYKVRVRCFDGSPNKNASAWSTSKRVICGWGDPPMMSYLTVVEHSSFIIVSWTKNMDCVAYQFCWKVNAVPGFSDSDSYQTLISRDVTRIQILGNSGDTIYIKARALDGAYQYSTTKSASGTVDPTPSPPVWPPG